jgi:hypothetical protein
MLDSLDALSGSAARTIPYHTTLQSKYQIERHGNTETLFAHARLPWPCVDALLTLAQGYSMVRCDIPNACKLCMFLQRRD